MWTILFLRSMYAYGMFWTNPLSLQHEKVMTLSLSRPKGCNKGYIDTHFLAYILHKNDFSKIKLTIR